MLRIRLASLVACTALSGLLAACQPLLIRTDHAGPYRPLTAGVLQLHEAVTIAAGRTRVFFQNGQPTTGINEFEPHCQLQVNTLAAQPQIIQPDRFTISRVNTRSDQVVMTSGLRLASLAHAGILHDMGASRIMYVYIFRLTSEHQPDVRELICGGAFDAPRLAQRPTLDEIASALGSYARLQLEPPPKVK